VRNLATLGGNIALASPFSDAILPLILFEARCEIRRFNAHNWVPLSRLLKIPWQFALEPGEIITTVSLPVPQWDVRQYVKLDLITQPSLSLLKFAGLAKVYKATISDFRIIWGGVDPLHLQNRTTRLSAGHIPSPVGGPSGHGFPGNGEFISGRLIRTDRFLSP
jgi:xanthine dehydrogenase FAD-binding subunit